MGRQDSLIHVVAGIVADISGRVLITRRPPGKHLAGCWEFPGGKRISGESRAEALIRELREELDLTVDEARPLIRYRHDYPEFSVDLDVWRVLAWRGEPRGLEGQLMDWVSPADLAGHDLLPADRPIMAALRLPDRYLVTGAFQSAVEFDARLTRAVAGGIRLVQLRVPGPHPDTLERLARRAVTICRGHGCQLLVNGSPESAVGTALGAGADGVHLPSRYLDHLDSRPVPETMLLGVSCHDRDEMQKAVSIGADFAVLGPVKATSSHPGASTLGWEGFRERVAELPLPVYAIGGMSGADVTDAWNAGARGIAAITALW